MKHPKILYNAILTPDGTLLESLTRHDYKIHQDTTDGKHYAVDGGTEYLRRGERGDSVELSVIDDGSMDISEVRKHFRWGTYGKDGTDPLRFVRLMDMDDDHVEIVLEDHRKLAIALMEKDGYEERKEWVDYLIRRFEEELWHRKQLSHNGDNEEA